MTKTQQGGFTLIELVVVIVILGILAAFAVPRFMGLENQARASTVNALAGSVRSATAMAHGVWMANGANGANIRVNNVNRAMVNGYPSLASINGLLESTDGFTYVPATGRFNRNGARDPARCFVQYAPATVAANGEVISPVITVPTAAQMTAGC
jgi:MSHA pilin protein MshA